MDPCVIEKSIAQKIVGAYLLLKMGGVCACAHDAGKYCVSRPVEDGPNINYPALLVSMCMCLCCFCKEKQMRPIRAGNQG